MNLLRKRATVIFKRRSPATREGTRDITNLSWKDHAAKDKDDSHLERTHSEASSRGAPSEVNKENGTDAARIKKEGRALVEKDAVA